MQKLWNYLIVKAVEQQKFSWNFIILRYVLIFMFCALIQNVKLLHNIEASSFLTELFTIEGVYPGTVPHF